MAEKVVIGNAELWHGDCREVLPMLPPVDCVITDPPYGQAVLLHHGRTGDRLRERYVGIAGDKCMSVGIEVLSWAERMGLPTVAFSSPYKPWPGQWLQHLVWDKGPALGGGGDIVRTWKHTYEIVQVARLARRQGPRDSAVLTFWDSPRPDREHMTQKPVALMAYLVGQVAAQKSKVLDPFLGSGTTGVACMQTGRAFCGVELVRRYFDIACRRIEDAQRQAMLLPPDEPRQPVREVLL